jgi:hypothetical protein
VDVTLELGGFGHDGKTDLRLEIVAAGKGGD